MKKYDVAIIGSGISSLTCAALLSKKGKSVIVLEKYARAGGYMHSFKRFGATFDTGAHYIGAMNEGQPFRVLMEYLGVYDQSFFEPLDPTGFDVIHFRDYSVKIPQGFDRYLQQLGDQFPTQRAGLKRYVDKVKFAVSKFSTYQFSPEIDELELVKLLEQPLSAVVDDCISDERLKAVIYAYCILHGVRPDSVPFGFHAVMTDSFVSGSCGFPKGGQALANRFIEVLRENGGEYISNCSVNRLVTENKTVNQIETSKGVFEATTVISGIHPKATFRMVDQAELKPAFRKRLDGTEETMGALGVYAVCKTEPDLNPRANHFYFNSSNIYDLFDLHNSPAKPNFAFVSRPNRSHESENGQWPLVIHSPCKWSWFEQWRETSYRKRGDDYLALKSKLSEQLFDFVEDWQPGLRDCVDRFDSSTPLSNLFFNGSEQGTPYGVLHDMKNTGLRAIGPRTHYKNLLLTGQSTLFPGILGSAISGLRTSGHLLGMKPILRELKTEMDRYQ